jgi:hypothetical protein
MAAVWSIQPGNLSTFPIIDEYVAFSHSVTYSDTDYPSEIYTVVLVP